MTDLRPIRGRALDHDGRITLARRLLRERAIMRGALPVSFQPLGAAEVLLTILIAEDRCEYPHVASIAAALEVGVMIAERWLRALAQHGLVERRSDAVALTEAGYDATARMAERIYLD